jgi:mono/diheme cytochrome c family protein
VGVRGKELSIDRNVTEKVYVWTAAMFAAVAAVLITQATTPAAAQQPSSGGDASGVDTAQIASQVDLGKTTYAQKCSHCHGPNMVNSGTITPDLRAFPDDRIRFVTTVKHGKNGRMPPWGDILSDDDIADVWAYIASRRKP